MRVHIVVHQAMVTLCIDFWRVSYRLITYTQDVVSTLSYSAHGFNGAESRDSLCPSYSGTVLFTMEGHPFMSVATSQKPLALFVISLATDGNDCMANYLLPARLYGCEGLCKGAVQ
jgi:hypothetical protein